MFASRGRTGDLASCSRRSEKPLPHIMGERYPAAMGDKDLPPRLPRLKIGLLSEIWHFWMTPVMRLRGRVTAATLPELPPEDSAPELLQRFEVLWAERHQSGKAPTGNGRALNDTCSRLLYPRFQLSGLWNVLDATANFAQPFIVAALVKNLRLALPGTLGFDYGLVVLLCLTTFVSAASIQQVLWNGGRVGLRAKIALSAAVYSKSLSLGNAALLTTSAGQATNLVAIDVQRLEMAYSFFHLLWLAPSNVIILGLILGVHVVGVACLPALAFLVILFAMQKVVGGKIARLRSTIAKRTDMRVKCMHDVLSGSEALKANTSEEGAQGQCCPKARAATPQLSAAQPSEGVPATPIHDHPSVMGRACVCAPAPCSARKACYFASCTGRADYLEVACPAIVPRSFHLLRSRRGNVPGADNACSHPCQSPRGKASDRAGVRGPRFHQRACQGSMPVCRLLMPWSPPHSAPDSSVTCTGRTASVTVRADFQHLPSSGQGVRRVSHRLPTDRALLDFA